MVGSAMAIDLSKKHKVTGADYNQEVLDQINDKSAAIDLLQLDVTDHGTLKKVLQPFDLVICAVPGFLGFNTLREIIKAGKNVVDISFFPEDGLTLNELAIEHGVTAIIDCGVAPGMDNLILGYHNEQMEVTDFECLVGGLPKIKKWPFNYKAPFSPIDVIEEYTRPARYVENGMMVTKPAMSDIEHVVFDTIGTLESFNSDGLRSIIFTMPHIPNVKEKTLRYPGHIEKVLTLRDSGFFSEIPINIKGQEIIPLEFTSKILFNEWELGSEEREQTIMRVTVSGTNKGVAEKIVYDLHDEYDPISQTSSMARTTGYTATAAANMLLEGLFQEKGVFPPELVGKHARCFEYIMRYLKERNVIYHQKS